MGWPQIVMIVLLGLNIGIGLVKHGEPRENYNFWTILIGAILEAGLLYFGGFWK